MRTRWRWLFCSSLAALLGFAWLVDHFELSHWLHLPVLGLVASAGIAFVCMVTNSHKRWPAALALLCAAPMGESLLSSLSRLPRFLVFLGAPGMLTVVGVLGTLASAGYLLAVPPPPSPDEPIPSARTT
jgi:hypothetical protein